MLASSVADSGEGSEKPAFKQSLRASVDRWLSKATGTCRPKRGNTSAAWAPIAAWTWEALFLIMSNNICRYLHFAVASSPLKVSKSCWPQAASPPTSSPQRLSKDPLRQYRHRQEVPLHGSTQKEDGASAEAGTVSMVLGGCCPW